MTRREELLALRERVEALVAEAETAFRSKPKALWSDRTYLAPKDAATLRALLCAYAASPADRQVAGPGIPENETPRERAG